MVVERETRFEPEAAKKNGKNSLTYTDIVSKICSRFPQPVGVASKFAWIVTDSKDSITSFDMESLILAQNERWRRA